MSIKKIITVPDKILREISQPLEKVSKEEQKLIETKFGEETLSKLINLFKNYQIEELTLFVEDKLYQSIDQLKKFDINLYKTIKDDSNLNYSFLK